MRSKMLTGLLAGLAAISFLTSVAVADDRISDTGLQLAQSRTETGQSGTGVRGTTGETSGGGQTYPGSSGTSGTGAGPGATDTGEEGGSPGSTDTGGEGAGPGATDTGGATSMGQPGSPENHVEEAMKHAKAAAADSGQKADAGTVAKHAQMAKTHVEAAQQEKPNNPHLKAALKSLDNAIVQGNKGDAEKARKAAHEAVTHLNAIK
jgi:hypothetical protein